ncbi:MAG: TIGR00730 family Rossman fold protein [Candidatus Pacebacteria bacterium]|jgi:uncharacterized protein (TIGR00730 family)|nr:TIGR00730 family Rossman fold protein [Candidatus Paceibacterota bacterium]MDD3072316.1 TIGR00730 family Rossman fold protein [Candidatus Paceibacterota bacterium]MDD3728902.1 TIGR00730 family Rossman fold protein [Candidatus Paceibacterota bacterium]MDD4201475.1 TIGR00730 family Rossman fold protein [Candidatus Paceibacterota bacterium]MDD4467482.1 TIGR00730 family Rossman fold protein [Candidatus Paceibacterota bacterium]
MEKEKNNNPEEVLEKEHAKHIKYISPLRISRIVSEFIEGFNFLNRYDKTVTFFGSSRVKPSHKYYKEAFLLSRELSKRGYTIVTGAGLGIMEAANKGAHEAGGESLGMNINLPKEQGINKYVKQSVSFRYFFIRKVMLTFASQAYIFFPGGFGTLDEFFEVVTLIQTGKVKNIPIILLHKSYWEPLLSFIDEIIYKRNRSIDKKDTKIYHLAKDTKEALTFLEKHYAQ